MVLDGPSQGQGLGLQGQPGLEAGVAVTAGEQRVGGGGGGGAGDCASVGVGL